MADQELAAAMSTVTVSHPPPPPRPNFPLPRELRDQIYGYLLDNKFNRLKRAYDHDSGLMRSETGCKAYHFHTNILAVNRDIHDEAEKILYERNIFVVASCEFISLSSALRSNTRIPIVTAKHAPRMKHHSLRVHVKAGDGLAKPGRRSDRIDSAVFLVDHIESFCAALAATFFGLPNPSLLITHISGTDVPLLYKSAVSSSFVVTTLRCDLRDTQFRVLDQTLQSLVLSPFVQAICPAMRVSITGRICDTEQVAQLKKIMGPTLICSEAKFWAQQENTCRSRESALEALDHGEIDVAEVLFSQIHEKTPALIEFHSHAWYASELASTLRVSMISSLVLATMYLGLINLKKRNFESAKRLFDSLVAYYSSLTGSLAQAFNKLPPELVDSIRHFYLLAYLYSGASKWNVGQAVSLLAESDDQLPHLAHDRKILALVADQSALLTEAHLPFDECSVSTLAMPDSRCYEDILYPKRPERFVGWQDVEMIRSLPARFKQEIIKKQVSAGLKLTDFSEF